MVECCFVNVQITRVTFFDAVRLNKRENAVMRCLMFFDELGRQRIEQIEKMKSLTNNTVIDCLFSNFASEDLDIDFSILISDATFFLNHKDVAVVVIVIVDQVVFADFSFDLNCIKNVRVHDCFIVNSFVMHHVDQIRIFFDF